MPRDLESLAREVRGKSGVRGSLLLLAIILLITTAGVWASMTEIDDVTRADGRIIPSSNVHSIQSADTGILEALHVREGQIVEAGETLVELDSTLAFGQFEQEYQRLLALQARLTRLQAEIDGDEILEFDTTLVSTVPNIIRSELSLFQARQAALAAEAQVLEQQRTQRQQEYEEGIVDVSTARNTLSLIEDEFSLIAPLVERRLEPESTLFGLRRSVAEWEGRKMRAEAALIRLQSGLAEIDDRIASLYAGVRSEALSELALTTADIAELETRLPALSQRLDRTELRSPVRGIVNQINLTTIGAVAQTGETIIEIVPLDDTLLVEAYIRPDDIAFLFPGQEVRVTLTAYDASRYGWLDGRISWIGADAVARPDRDETAFIAHIETSTNILDNAGSELEIIPGMIANVDVLAGRKTVLEYITRPIVRVRDVAFRD